MSKENVVNLIYLGSDSRLKFGTVYRCVVTQSFGYSEPFQVKVAGPVKVEIDANREPLTLSYATKGAYLGDWIAIDQGR